MSLRIMDLGFGLSVSLMGGRIHSSGQAIMEYGSVTVVWRSVQLKRDMNCLSNDELFDCSI